MKYFVSIYRLFVKKAKPKIDEFDEQYGFLLKHGIVKEKQYNEVKSYYFQHHQSSAE